MSGLEARILSLVKDLEEEKRLADKRAKQLYLAGGGGTFLDLSDTPASYVGQAGKFIKVNATPDALEFVDHNKALHDALNIDADKCDGKHVAEASTVSTIAARNSAGDIQARLFRSEYDTLNATCNIFYTAIDTAGNNYLRPSSRAQVITSLEAGGLKRNWFSSTGCRAYRSSSYAITGGVWTQVNFNAESWDLGSRFSSYKYNCPTTGYYFVHVSVHLSNVASGEKIRARIMKSGGTIAYAYNSAGGTGYHSIHVTTIGQFNAGQLISAEAYCQNACNIYGNSDATYIVVYRLM